MYNTPSRSPFLDNQNNHNCTGDSSQKTRHHRRCTKVCIPATANCKGSGKHLRKEPDDAPPESNEDMGNGETNPHKNVAEDSGTKVCRELDSNCTENHDATSNGDNKLFSVPSSWKEIQGKTTVVNRWISRIIMVVPHNLMFYIVIYNRSALQNVKKENFI